MPQRKPQAFNIHQTLPVQGAVILGGIPAKPQNTGVEDNGFTQFRDFAYQGHAVRLRDVVIVADHLEAHDTSSNRLFRHSQGIRFMGMDPQYWEQPIRIVPAELQHLVHTRFRVKAVGLTFLGIMRQHNAAKNTTGFHLLEQLFRVHPGSTTMDVHIKTFHRVSPYSVMIKVPKLSGSWKSRRGMGTQLPQWGEAVWSPHL